MSIKTTGTAGRAAAAAAATGFSLLATFQLLLAIGAPFGSRCLGWGSGTIAVGAADRERIRRRRVGRGCTHRSRPRRLPDVSRPAERVAVGHLGARSRAGAQRAR